MKIERSFLLEIKNIWESARKKAFTLVNSAMIDAYWQIGWRIVQEEQHGESRAQYGAFILRELAKQLTAELEKGLDERELRKMRQFYLCFPSREALRPELTWSHYRHLLRIQNAQARSYYLNEAADQSWGTRLLERNIQTGFYERLISSRQPQTPLEGLSPKGSVTPFDLVKDPYVFEFLTLKMPDGFSESDLETAIISKIQHFLMEMGKGFAFVGRQYVMKTDTKLYYIDLVFYNFLLKAFVLVDLKISALTPQDIGQMDMYVRMFEDLKKIPGDNPTVGIILCAEKDTTLAKYSVLEENRQLFASEYRLVLPSEDDLSREIEKETAWFKNNPG